MSNTLKYSLTPLIFILLLCAGNITNAADIKKYEWPYSDRDIKSEMGDAPVFIEMFSSQACVFCPNADNFFKDLIEKTGIYGVSCHVDYYSKSIDTLSKEFCSKRQKSYMMSMGATTYYTPQMVINGDINAIGYKYDDVIKSIIEASNRNIKKIKIEKTENKFSFDIEEMDLLDNKDISILLMLYSKPHKITIEHGRNKGRDISYINMTEKIEEIAKWDGSESKIEFAIELIDADAGFTIIAQDKNSGSIVAIGDYKIQQ